MLTNEFKTSQLTYSKVKFEITHFKHGTAKYFSIILDSALLM